jgi:hypothetical protein
MTGKSISSPDYELVRNSEGLREIIYCIAKSGVWSADRSSRARLIQDAKSLEELKTILALFQFAVDDELNDDDFSTAVRFLDLVAEIPTLDRLLKWPWSESYEAPDVN